MTTSSPDTPVPASPPSPASPRPPSGSGADPPAQRDPPRPDTPAQQNPDPPLRHAEFLAGLESLPHDLRDQVRPMQSYAISGKKRHAPVTRIVSRLFELAGTDQDYEVLASKVTEAEDIWRELRAAAAERQRLAGLRAMSSGSWKRSIRNGYRGNVSRWASHPAPLVAATDASRVGLRIGWGYVVSDGKWGLRHIRYTGMDPTGRAKVLVNELRAVYFLLTAIPPATRLRLLIDSLDARQYLTRWREGDRSMPPGYDLRPRIRAPAPTLVLLADRVEQMPKLTVEWVRAHRDHPLNEAAHSLSVIARRADRSERGYDTPDEMTSMVDRFLEKWHSDRPTA